MGRLIALLTLLYAPAAAETVPIGGGGDQVNIEAHGVSTAVVSYHNHANQLSLADLSGVKGHSLRLTQSGPNQVYRPEAHKQPNKASVAHNPRESGHYLLGLKIALGTLAILSGFYFLANASSQGRRVKIGRAVAFYPLFGLLSIGAGTLLIAHSLLG